MRTLVPMNTHIHSSIRLDGVHRQRCTDPVVNVLFMCGNCQSIGSLSVTYLIRRIPASQAHEKLIVLVHNLIKPTHLFLYIVLLDVW